MKDNCLVLKDKNGKKTEYRIILDVKDTSKDLNYVIYTEDKKDKNGSIISYASSYVLSDKGNMTKFKPLAKDEMDFLNKILSSLDNN
jgi:uncharacterized protein YrzB (UPF0473 family)